MIWAEETTRLQAARNCAESRVWTRSGEIADLRSGIEDARLRRVNPRRIPRTGYLRIREVRGVGEVDRIRSQLQGEPFGQLELTSQAQVHAEITRAAELVAVGVAEMRLRNDGAYR